MTTIPRVRDLPDLLTVVPLLAGFTPTDAVVLVCPTPSGRVALQRVSVPPRCHWGRPETDAAALVDLVLTSLDAAGLDRATVIGYLQDPMDESYVGALVNAVQDELLTCGVDVMGVALVCEGSWWRPDCPCGDPECGEPRPVPSLHESAAATALLVEGAVVHESAEALLAPWVQQAPDALDAETLAARTTAWLRANPRTRRRRHALALWARLVHDQDACFSEREVAGLLWALRSVPERDALIAWLTPGDMPVELLDAGAWSVVEELLGEPAGPAAGHWSQQVVTRNLQALLARVPATGAAPLETLAAVWAWWNGDGIVARFLLERALDAEPGHTLAGLLLRLVHHGIPMAGARHRSGR